MSNNSFYVESYFEKPDNSPDKESQLIRAKEMLTVFSGLRANRNFNKFIAQVIEPEIENLQRQLELETDRIRLHQVQGMIKGLRLFKDLKRYEKFNSERVVQLSQELNNDGKED